MNDSDVIHPSDVAEAIARTLSERSQGGQNDPQSTRWRARRDPETIDFSTREQTG